MLGTDMDWKGLYARIGELVEQNRTLSHRIDDQLRRVSRIITTKE